MRTDSTDEPVSPPLHVSLAPTGNLLRPTADRSAPDDPAPQPGTSTASPEVDAQTFTKGGAGRPGRDCARLRRPLRNAWLTAQRLKEAHFRTRVAPMPCYSAAGLTDA